jgi:hypothetical protein
LGCLLNTPPPPPPPTHTQRFAHTLRTKGGALLAIMVAVTGSMAGAVWCYAVPCGVEWATYVRLHRCPRVPSRIAVNKPHGCNLWCLQQPRRGTHTGLQAENHTLVFLFGCRKHCIEERPVERTVGWLECGPDQQGSDRAEPTLVFLFSFFFSSTQARTELIVNRQIFRSAVCENTSEKSAIFVYV